MTPVWRQHLIFIAKILISILLVGFILSRVDTQKLVTYFLNLRFAPLLEIFTLSIGILSIQFLRWKFLLENNSTHFHNSDLLPSFFAGFAFRMMIPGGHAEISKIYLLPGKKSGKVVAFGLEKFFQTYIKIFLSMVFLPFLFPQFTRWSIGIIAVLIALFIGLPRLPLLRKYQEKSINNYALFFKTFFFSISIFILLGIQYFILLNENNTISLWDTYKTVVFIWSAGVIPISYAGLGIREGLAIFFLQKFQIPAAFAVATALFLFTINMIIPALIGMIFIYQKRTHLKDIRNTLKNSKTLLQKLRVENFSKTK